MKLSIRFRTYIAAAAFLVTFALSGSAFGQKSNVVAIDPEKNLVRLPNSDEDPPQSRLCKPLKLGSRFRPAFGRSLMRVNRGVRNRFRYRRESGS